MKNSRKVAIPVQITTSFARIIVNFIFLCAGAMIMVTSVATQTVKALYVLGKPIVGSLFMSAKLTRVAMGVIHKMHPVKRRKKKYFLINTHLANRILHMDDMYDKYHYSHKLDGRIAFYGKKNDKFFSGEMGALKNNGVLLFSPHHAVDVRPVVLKKSDWHYKRLHVVNNHAVKNDLFFKQASGDADKLPNASNHPEYSL